MEEFEQEFEKLFSKARNKEHFLYGVQEEEDTVHAEDYMKTDPFINTIPHNIVSKILDRKTPKITYKDVRYS